MSLVLTNAGEKLEITATTVIPFTVHYADYVGATPVFTPGVASGDTINGTKDLLAAPGAGQRVVRTISVHNDSGGADTITVQLDVAAVNYTIIPVTLADGYTLCYDEDGWKVLDASGGIATTLFTHAILGPHHSDAATDAVTRGSLIYGNATPLWDELVVGAANEVLTNNAADVMWSTGAIDLTAGKTLVVSAALTLAGVDGKSLTLTDSLTVQGGNAGILSFGAAATVTINGNCTLNDWFDQSVKQAASPTFAGVSLPAITFNGISGANIITVPDNLADALHLSDAGGIEYLKIISTDTQPIVRFNDGGVDVDFEVEAFGVADALQVRGADGQITLGILTAGFVKSSAAGVLSVATEVALTEIASYTQGDLIVGGAADWTDLAIGGAHQILKVNAGATDPAWASFDWDDMAAGAAADMAHDHSAAGEGGQILGDTAGPLTLTIENAGCHILGTGGNNDLVITPGSALTADRILTLTTGDVARTIVLQGNPTLADWFDQAVKQASSPTFAGLSISAGQGITMADDTWIGIGAALERIVFDTAGDVTVMGANFGVNIATPDDRFHVADDVNSYSNYFDLYSATTAGKVAIELRKSHHDTIGTITETINAEQLGIIRFKGCNTTPAFAYGAYILASQTGAANTYAPTQLIFQTYNATAANAPVKIEATLILPNMTTAERNAMAGITNGMIIYNTTTTVVEAYENGAWVNL